MTDLDPMCECGNSWKDHKIEGKKMLCFNDGDPQEFTPLTYEIPEEKKN